ncbi:mediator of RNA polymerase II transcription subunit 12-like [Pollicipes pollicipes]|uniref:mediator of RNA polymerase II transcription subunit 12-like n=1 Tax=Pollicipes pollicipes TaxID=41117 RepID=UPI001884BD8D|nr:mediator of RNA polymerase II transcription subunit 12-like [Pollicipes pollicipes]
MLAKKVPIFNKKDEILSKLCDYSVPTVRACWLIKMSSAYYVAISETKNKSKRQLPDQTQEWTLTLERFLKEQLTRLEEHYSWTPQVGVFPAMSGSSTEEQKVAARHWQYGTQLAGVMYEQGLLDREPFLEWVLDVFRARAHDDGLLKLVVPLLLQYVGEFTRSELLARKLAYYACKKLNQMVAEMDASGGRGQSPVFGQGGQEAGAPPPPAQPVHSNPLVAAFIRLVNCNFYESIVYGLGSVLQMILYKNPTALVWNNLGDGKSSPLSSSPLGGSPLDLNGEWRTRLRRVEDDVLERSRASDLRWSVQTSTELTVGRVLAALDALDQHKWHRTDDTNNFDTLYARVFPPAGRDGADGRPSDDALVQLLCEWAVSPQRLEPAVPLPGHERAGAGRRHGLGGRSRQSFASLVLLFLELTRHDVFSHDQYLRALISRGELRTNPASPAQSAAAFTRSEHHDADDDKLDIDDDLDKLVQHIKSTNADMDNPDSPKEGFSLGTGHTEKLEARRQNRHLIYTTHFPLPQDDAYTDDDKQRHILLFGVKKARDEARHAVKKMNKEIMKLFGKKLSIDVSEGGKVKRQSRGEFPFEPVVQRFQALSFYDQHQVTHQCALQVVEMLSAFAAGNSSYLPVVEHVSFLFDLMELAVNIRELLDCCQQMLRELPDVEGQLHSKNSARAGTYATSLALHIVGACRRYHRTLILSQDHTAAIFEGLCKVVKHVRNHTDCSSAERCVLAHLVNLYSSCSFLRSKHYEARFESFSNAYLKLKQLFNTSLKPSGSSFSRNAAFMAEYVSCPTRPIEPAAVRALNESGANRYSFVCNVVIEVCNTADSERLSDLAVLAAEATARCNAPLAEWLDAFSLSAVP